MTEILTPKYGSTRLIRRIPEHFLYVYQAKLYFLKELYGKLTPIHLIYIYIIVRSIVKKCLVALHTGK